MFEKCFKLDVLIIRYLNLKIDPRASRQIKYLDIRLFVDSLLNYFETGQMKYAYHPVFFREHYVPESEEAKDCLNRWTTIIQHEEWYLHHVNKGERAGLVF